MSRLPIVIIIINNNNNSHNGGDSQRCFISPQAIATSRASAAADTIMTYSFVLVRQNATYRPRPTCRQARRHILEGVGVQDPASASEPEKFWVYPYLGV